PDALHRHVHPVEVAASHRELHAGLDAAPDAERREGARIARATVLGLHAGHAPGSRADDLHVLEARAAVLGGDVPAPQVLDEPAEGAEQPGAIELLPRLDDDALATSVREPGDGGLVGHAAREPERIDQRLLLGVVV